MGRWTYEGIDLNHNFADLNTALWDAEDNDLVPHQFPNHYIPIPEYYTFANATVRAQRGGAQGWCGGAGGAPRCSLTAGDPQGTELGWGSLLCPNDTVSPQAAPGGTGLGWGSQLCPGDEVSHMWSPGHRGGLGFQLCPNDAVSP